MHEIVDSNDVGMGELLAAQRLHAQALDFLFVRDQVGRQKLQHHGLLGHAIMREPDRAHAAAAERTFEIIPLKHPLPDGEWVFSFDHMRHPDEA